MKLKLRKWICSKEFFKAAMAVAIPLMLQQLISSSVNLVDNLMVGQLGDASLGSVAAMNRYYMIALFGANGFCAAGSVFIAQFYGAQKKERMEQSYLYILSITFIIMSSFCLLAFFFSESVMRFYTSDTAVIAEGMKYIKIACWSYLPMGITLAVYGALRAVGEMKIPLKCSIVAVLTNTVLNYCFIFGNFGFPRMGIEGAALATLISRTLEVILAYIGMHRSKYSFRFSFKELIQIPSSLIVRITMKGAPLVFNEVFWSIGMSLLFRFYATRGSVVMSGYSIAGTISDIFFVLFGGMAAATTVMVSQPLGADHLEEGKRNAYWLIGLSFMLSIVFGILMFSSSFLIPFLYSAISLDAKDVAINFIRVQSVMYWIYMLNTQCYFTLRAGGDMKHTLIMDSGFMWSVNIPFVAILTYFTGCGYLWLYLAGQATDLLKMVLCFRLLKKEKWVVNLAQEEEIELES